jgi:multidrug efflux pump subunit AcrB
MERVIKWFSENHVAGNFLMLVVVILGFTSWFELKKEIFPELAIDAAIIQIPYPNATPEEVERGVCVPVEEAVADLTGIKKLSSAASQNVGVVTVEAETNRDIRELMDDLKSRIDAIDNFPEETEKPVIEEVIVREPVLSLAMTSDVALDEVTLNRIAERIRDELLTYDPGPATSVGDFVANLIRGKASISQVAIAGTRDFEISIEVSEEKLRQFGLTHRQVADAVRRTSVDLPGGSVRAESGEMILRALGKRYDAPEFRTIPVATRADGSEILLEDVANVVDGFEDVDLSSNFDDKPAVVVNVYRVGNEDTLALASMVRDYVEKTKNTLPEGVTLSVWNDQSTYLQGRLDLLKRNAVSGLLLVLLVLALFLRPSLAFLVALGIPISFAGGIWLMPVLGISINMISLFSFILVLGIVVDDAIVTGENVYSRIQAGEHPRIAAWKGTEEVSVVVVFGVLTTMMAFTPMLGLSGVSGKIWPNIPLVVIPVLAFSLLQSKLVLPAHLALLAPHSKEMPRNPIFRLQRHIANGLERFVLHVYRPVLVTLLRCRYVTAAGFLSILILALAFVVSGHVKFKFFPDVEGDILSAKFELTEGAPFTATETIANKLEEAAIRVGSDLKNREGDPVSKHHLASAGSQPFKTGFSPGGPPKATHIGEVTLELSPAAGRDVTSDMFIDRWREEVGDLPGVVELSFRAETAGGGNAIDVNLSGPDLDRLREATDWAKAELAKYPGVIDISDSGRAGKDELRLIRLTQSGKSLGLRLEDVAMQVRDAFYGNEAQRLQRGRDEVKVMIRFPEGDRRSLASLETMKIRTAGGDEVPFQQVVEYEFDSGPAVINRTDRQRSIKITADVTASTNANEVVGAYTADVLDKLATLYPGVAYDFEGEQEDQANSVREIGIGFLFALVGMYVLIAIPLKSYWQPLIIMSVIPFGLVGAIAGHVLLGLNLSIMSMCGIVALAGVVVNDSLVMVDFVNRHRSESSVRQAAADAGVRRFRAILLTSLTTFVGLMPMLLETDVQARFLIPMAVSLGFGILFATAITLLLVPCVYLILEDIRNRLMRPTSDRAA